MALIECSECSNKISDKAKSCPNCGCPIQVDNVVKVKFPRGKQLINMKCRVYDENYDLIAECREGEIAIFELFEETEIIVQMSSRLGEASILAKPGDRLEVSFRTFGIGISRVDIL